jgi:NAD(P)-dependent dehydrogenase (short-subunit alcohol dehydrogenase family)
MRAKEQSMDVTTYLPSDLFAGQSVFITGGGSGINLGIARHFAVLGAGVAICGRNRDRLDAAVDVLRGDGAKVSSAVADVRDADAIQAAIDTACKELGPISVLVCGAAGNFPCLAERMSPNGFRAVVEIDLIGSFNASRACFAQLRQTRGSVIFISAGQSFAPYVAQAHVGAAKAGVDQLMRTLALEWGRFGIRSNSIVPGPIADTEGVRRLVPQRDDVLRRCESAIPLGRFGTVEDIGQAAVFLASPLASYVTGAVLIVDGGQNLPGSGLFSELLANVDASSTQE